MVTESWATNYTNAHELFVIIREIRAIRGPTLWFTPVFEATRFLVDSRIGRPSRR